MPQKSKKPWTDEENEIIKTHYSEKGASGLLDLLPGRTAGAIVYHANKALGLKCNNPKTGNKENIRFINSLSARSR